MDKNYQFKREHSLEMPQPSRLHNHTKQTLIWFCVYVALVIAGAFLRISRIPLACVSMVLMTILIADEYRADVRVLRFYEACLRRGGKTVAPWNERLLNRNGTAALRLGIAILLLLLYALMGAVVYGEITKSEGVEVFSWVYILLVVPITLVSNRHPRPSMNVYCPFIFMDIEVGMVFGGALFSYDALRGIVESENPGGFELFYGSDMVASGVMLRDDMRYLQDILALRRKNADVLTEDKKV
jgi:hypothetical protein